VKTASRYLFGVLLIAAGANHFWHPDFYINIMPPYVPWHRELVLISGAFEILLGVLLLVPRTQIVAAWGLVALLIAVFPANLHMALHPAEFSNIPEWALWLRLPLQGLLIAWAYGYTRPNVTSAEWPTT
jgi:uncharacterized membrane protein